MNRVWFRIQCFLGFHDDYLELDQYNEWVMRLHCIHCGRISQGLEHGR